MKFALLADAFLELESTSRRTEAVRIVGRLLDRATSSEREKIVYLLQGQLRPAFEGVEIGLGERLLIRALARAYDEPEAAVTRRFKQLGDLGLVAEALATPRRGSLNVAAAYRALLEIAEGGGAGSVERKTALCAALLGRATPREARYLVRMAQGRLRLGVGDATVIEAAAAGALGDAKRKPAIEQAYNVRSDLGGVVGLAYSRGGAGLARVAPTPGVPVRPALAQRLPSAAAIVSRMGEVQAEPKYDGFRLQLHRNGKRVWAFSRRLENVTGMFPELTQSLARQVRARRVILDGEAVVQDAKTGQYLPFQVTITRKRKHGVTEASERYPLRLFVFDLLSADGRNWLPRAQRERSREVARLIRPARNGRLSATETLTTSSAAELTRYFNAMLRRGLEGIVAKRPDAPYRAGARGYDWVKLKRSYHTSLRDTVDLVLVGYLKGRGRRAALGAGSLLAATYDPDGDRYRTVAKIGSGLSEEAWKALARRLDRLALASRPGRVDSLIEPDVWVEPRIVVEVLADEITRSPRHTTGRDGAGAGYALRFPRMLGLRADKGPRDATTEREILDLFRMQEGRAGRSVRTGRRKASAAGSRRAKP